MNRIITKLRNNPRYAVFAALLFFFIGVGAVTYPFIFHPTSTLIAPWGGDINSSVGKFEALKEGHLNPFRAVSFPWIAYPDGPKNNIGVNRVSFFSELSLWLGSRLFGAITAHSLLSFLGMLLTAFITFLFVRMVTRSALAATVAGFAYGFSPVMYALIVSNMTYANMWLYILPLWAFWVLASRGYSVRRASLAALSIVPAMFWTPYFTFHILLVGAICLLVSLIYMFQRDGLRKTAVTGGATGIFWAVLVVFYHYLGTHTASTEIPVRSLTEIYHQSAHPLMFLLPGAFSWGPHGNALLVHLVPRAAGLNIYLGLSVIALGLVGAVMLFREWRKNITENHGVRVAFVLAASVLIGCMLFSLPPTFRIFGIELPSPNLIVAHLVPALRAGQRFVMPMMGAASVMAGIGFWMLTKRFDGRRRFALTALAITIIAVDLFAFPPGMISSIPSYPSLAALKQAPMAPVAEFETGSLLLSFPQLPCVLQHEFRKPLINDCGLGRSAALGVILELPRCEQIPALQAIGTGYLILPRGDIAISRCLAQYNAKERQIAEDDTYRVIELRKMSPAEVSTTKARLKLP